jgi:hypothetical protein
VRSRVGLQLLGLALFLFIPLVLYLFVAHPEPVAASLVAGVATMAGHRFLARPYMRAASDGKCLWCNRAPAREGERLPVPAGDATLQAAVCARHREPASRFLAFLARRALPLRAGILLPLALLLLALALTAAGRAVPLAQAVAIFQLLVGITVMTASLAYRAAAPEPPARLPFPAHNFFLLGIRNLLWIFRIVGLWWIWRGAAALLGAS